MLKICALCAKTWLSGRNVVRKGLAKKKGGTGKKIVRSSLRAFRPNLQKMRILINNKPKKVYICTRCLKKSKIQKV